QGGGGGIGGNPPGGCGPDGPSPGGSSPLSTLPSRTRPENARQSVLALTTMPASNGAEGSQLSAERHSLNSLPPVTATPNVLVVAVVVAEAAALPVRSTTQDAASGTGDHVATTPSRAGGAASWTRSTSASGDAAPTVDSYVNGPRVGNTSWNR